MTRRTKHEFHCDCTHKPLLAMYGLESNNRPYVHVRVYKGNRLYAEIYTNHTVVLTCRDCFRRHRIIMRGRTVKMLEVPQYYENTVPG